MLEPVVISLGTSEPVSVYAVFSKISLPIPTVKKSCLVKERGNSYVILEAINSQGDQACMELNMVIVILEKKVT